MTAIRTSAPAKVVLWGEYAVLAGAPAAVLTLDRYTQVELGPADLFSSFTADGLASGSIHTQDLPNLPITSLLLAILRHINKEDALGLVRCHMDTSNFYANSQKLGIGSSAALCVALYHAVCTHVAHTPTLNEAIEIHRAWQGGSGSGMDVAASWHGGVIRFQKGEVSPIEWPANLSFDVIYTGSSASTFEQIGKFSGWRKTADISTLDELCAQSESLFSTYTEASAWHDYIAALRALDQAGHLNIFTQEHERLATIAHGLDVVYKPCGAGGGDIGISISDDPSRLFEFRKQATQVGFTSLQTEIALHGVHSR